MSSLEAAMLWSRQKASTMGIRMTTTGVLLTKGETMNAPSVMTSRAVSSLPLATLLNSLERSPINPVLSREALRMNMHTTVSGPLLAKLDSTSRVLRIPVSMRTAVPVRAVISTGIHSLIKLMNNRTSRMPTIHCWAAADSSQPMTEAELMLRRGSMV